MEDYQIRQLGLILADFIRGLGMMADNMQRQQLNESMSYTDKDFESIAANIEFYSDQLR